MDVNLTQQYYGSMPHPQIIKYDIRPSRASESYDFFDETTDGAVIVEGRSGNSNEQLVIPTDSSDTASLYTQQAGGGRVMREIIV